ncbi:hypothetical protein AB833_30770 [Chromatiales bacterium (ex Bugula neritina AB1)]|nr:hypothetical protein AB833_30770 [Chromatiales bacterium (ex Bugula neritina AB1)]
MNNNENAASLPRRLAAMFYDSLLLIAVLFTVSAIAVALNGGLAVTHPVYYLILLLVSFVFFGWFWTRDGQTLGMRTWRIKLTHETGTIIDWKQALIRFAAAAISLLPAGIGLLWLLIDADKKALHDRLSSTRIINVPKRA